MTEEHDFYYMIAVNWFDCSCLISHTYLFYQINGILFIDFNLVACDFLKFDWCKMLNSHVNVLFNISPLRMTVASVEKLENWRYFEHNLRQQIQGKEGIFNLIMQFLWSFEDIVPSMYQCFCSFSWFCEKMYIFLLGLFVVNFGIAQPICLSRF